MSSTVAKNQQTTRSAESIPDEQEEVGEDVMPSAVSSQVYLKPGTLDREVVLKRIRQRKRMNKVTGAIQGLFGFQAAEKSNVVKPDDGKSVSVKWVDDAFAAP